MIPTKTLSRCVANEMALVQWFGRPVLFSQVSYSDSISISFAHGNKKMPETEKPPINT